eukprot:TRINITY_DN1153_c0_g1_i1.p1 TRINITY_DN1153_c0_g1~~TRINITY_DN1153_c0_g1_i1.p1  ORF type:complete len:1440 (+),score=368.28 TRINITY_DN1153_c0_g1_i1:64-4383(+)
MPRTGKAKAATSGAAAELLAQKFGSVSFAGAMGSFGWVSSEQSLPTTFSVPLKKLTKKDTVTRLKGLQELQQLFEESDTEVLTVVLPHWAAAYARMILDTERRVREALHVTFLSLIRKTKKLLAPHLQTILPPWLVCLQDSCHEVVSAADAAMTEAFPSKRLDAFIFYKKPILNYLLENSRQTVQSLADDHSTPPDVQQERYERVVGTAYLSAAFLLLQFPTEQSEQVLDLFLQMFNSDFWKMFNSSKVAVGIRRAIYQSAQAVIAKLPVVIEQQLAEVTDAVMGALGETDPISQAAVWGVVLALTKAFPQAWSAASKKHTFQKLFAALRAGLRGGGAAAYQFVLPLVAFIPQEAIAAGTEFHKQLFESIWKPVSTRNAVAFENAILESYTDCALLFLKRAADREDKTAFVPEILTLSATRMLQHFCTVEFISDALLQVPSKLATILNQAEQRFGNGVVSAWWSSVAPLCAAGRTDRVAAILVATKSDSAPIATLVRELAIKAEAEIRNKSVAHLEFLRVAGASFGFDKLVDGGAQTLWTGTVLPLLTALLQSELVSADEVRFFDQLAALSQSLLLASDSVEQSWSSLIDSVTPRQAMALVRRICTANRERFWCAALDRLAHSACTTEPWNEETTAFLQFCVDGVPLISGEQLRSIIEHLAPIYDAKPESVAASPLLVTHALAISLETSKLHHASVLSALVRSQQALMVAGPQAAAVACHTLLKMTLLNLAPFELWEGIDLDGSVKDVLLKETVTFVAHAIRNPGVGTSVERWQQLAAAANVLFNRLSRTSAELTDAIRAVLLDEEAWQTAMASSVESAPHCIDMSIPTDSVLIAGSANRIANLAQVPRVCVRVDAPVALFAFSAAFVALRGDELYGFRAAEQEDRPLCQLSDSERTRLMYNLTVACALNSTTTFRSYAVYERADYGLVCENTELLFKQHLEKAFAASPELSRALVEMAVRDSASAVSMAALTAVMRCQNWTDELACAVIQPHFASALQSVQNARLCAALCQQPALAGLSYVARLQAEMLSTFTGSNAEPWLTLASVLFAPEVAVDASLIPNLNEIMIGTNGVRKCAALAAFLRCCFYHCRHSWSQRDWQYLISRVTEGIMQCAMDGERNAHMCLHFLALTASLSQLATTKPKIDPSATIDETTAIVTRTRSLQQAMEKINPLLLRWIQSAQELEGPLDSFQAAVLDQLSQAASTIPQHQVSDVGLLFRLLQSPYVSMQRVAYSLLVAYAAAHQHHPQEDKEAEGAAVVIPTELRALMSMPSPEEGFVVGYLLSWLVFFAYFDDESAYQRLDLTMFARGSGALPLLLQTLIEMLPLERGVTAVDETAVRKLNVHSVTYDQLTPLCMHVLFCVLQRLPALARLWFTDCTRHVAMLLEKFVAKHISPLLIADELQRLTDAKAVENLTCAVSRPAREARVKLELSELVMERM